MKKILAALVGFAALTAAAPALGADLGSGRYYKGPAYEPTMAVAFPPILRNTANLAWNWEVSFERK